MAVGVKIELDRAAIARLIKAVAPAAEKTIDALKTDVVATQVMPYDLGDMQNNQTFTVTEDNSGSVDARLVTGSPQARRLYYHPEYNFQMVNNPNAGGLWLEPWINGDRKDFVKDTFAELYKKETGDIMLALEQVRDWLKSQDPELKDCIAVGAIDGNKEKYVGVYPLKLPGSSQRICLGGAAQTKYQQRGVSILIHWTKDAAAADAKATAIYGLLYGLAGVMMGGTLVISANPGPAPIPVGKDAHGISEYVIQIKIFYGKE